MNSHPTAKCCLLVTAAKCGEIGFLLLFVCLFFPREMARGTSTTVSWRQEFSFGHQYTKKLRQGHTINYKNSVYSLGLFHWLLFKLIHFSSFMYFHIIRGFYLSSVFDLLLLPTSSAISFFLLPRVLCPHKSPLVSSYLANELQFLLNQSESALAKTHPQSVQKDYSTTISPFCLN